MQRSQAPEAPAQTDGHDKKVAKAAPFSASSAYSYIIEAQRAAAKAAAEER